MDTLTLALALSYVKKQVEEAKKEGFKVQVEQNRSILDRQGEEKVFYFLPKSTVKPSDGYDEFVYTNNKWEQVGATDVDLSSYGVAFSLEDGILSLLNSSGAVLSQVLIDGADGKSAYQLAVEKGYSGTEEEWLASLKGADGQQGIAGQDGKDGEDGKDWVPTEQELDGIADRVVAKLPTTQGVLYGD